MLRVIRRLIESILARIRQFIKWLRRLLRGAGTCDIRFSLQGRYASVVDLSAFRISNTVVTIHPSALLAGDVMNEADFIAKPENDIHRTLDSYLNRRMIHPGSNHLVVLDMEPRYPDPTDPIGEREISFSPSHLGDYEANQSLQDELIRAYIRRIRVAREELHRRQPTVKLGLYQVIVPMGTGQDNATFRQRMRGYGRAGELGMYDVVDYLVPVLYNRFGPNDVRRPDGSYDLARLHRWIEQATHQAIRETQRLTRRNGSAIPLAPYLSFWVFNSPRITAHNLGAIRHETMRLQLQILQQYGAVEIIVMWSGWETDREMGERGVETINYTHFLGQVGGLPPPGCT